MTATVTEDAELGFLTTKTLMALLRGNADLCQQMLRILSDKVAHSEDATREMRRKEKLPRVASGVA